MSCATRDDSAAVERRTIRAVGSSVKEPRSGAWVSGCGITVANAGGGPCVALADSATTTAPAITTARRRRREAAHPLTAPDVSPNAMRRWTRRKKITTGIAVSVDAAISPPQSVFRLVP